MRLGGAGFAWAHQGVPHTASLASTPRQRMTTYLSETWSEPFVFDTISGPFHLASWSKRSRRKSLSQGRTVLKSSGTCVALSVPLV